LFIGSTLPRRREWLILHYSRALSSRRRPPESP